MRCFLLVLCWVIGTNALVAQPATTKYDWPQFLGPNGDSQSPETGILTQWPANGLKILWETEMGQGFAPPVIQAGRLYHFDRFRDTNRLTCRDAITGKSLWKYEYETDYIDSYGYSPGPRACPVVDGERVYCYGPEGMLVCLKSTDGTVVWSNDTRKNYHFQQNFFGVGSVPLVYYDLLIVAIGGSPKGERVFDLRDAKGNGTAIVAFDKKTGKEIYRFGNELASYASPTIRKIADKDVGLYFARGGLVLFDPKTGKELTSFPWRAEILESVNASNPTVVGSQILLTECYGPGGVLLDYQQNKLKVLWSDVEKDRDEKSLRCHWNTPVHRDGYVYGSSGRHENEATLRCVRWKDGEVMWEKKGLSRTSLLWIDGHFLCLSERSELILFKENHQKYQEIAVWKTDLDYPAWAAPIVCNGILYLRGADRLIACEIMKK